MGFISDLLGVVPPEQAPQLTSIYPANAASKVMSGSLPKIVVDKIILGKGETCHFVDVAAVITEKNRYKSVRAGGSYRIFKGYTAHLGQSQTVPVKEKEYTKGILYITNQRIICVSSKNGFDKKIKSLTAVTPYKDGITLQFGTKAYSMLLPDGTIPKAVLDMLV